MRDFSFVKVLQVSFLFVGTVIGAGFATGEEVRLFFQNKSIFSIILSGVLFGFFSIVFLLFGKISARINFKYFNKGSSFLIFLAELIIYVAMVGGAENLIREFIGVDYGGIITSIICSIILINGKKALFKFNTIIVPLILICTFVVYIRRDVSVQNVEIGAIAAIVYTAMNMLGGGYIISTEGANMNKREIIFCGLVVSIFITIMLYMIYGISVNIEGSMPLYIVARRNGVGAFAAIIIYLSIISTMLSSLAIVKPTFSRLIHRENLMEMLFIILAIVGSGIGFSTIVKFTYPIVGYMGIVYLLSILIILANHKHFVHKCVTSTQTIYKKQERKYYERNRNCKKN